MNLPGLRPQKLRSCMHGAVFKMQRPAGRMTTGHFSRGCSTAALLLLASSAARCSNECQTERESPKRSSSRVGSAATGMPSAVAKRGCSRGHLPTPPTTQRPNLSLRKGASWARHGCAAAPLSTGTRSRKRSSRRSPSCSTHRRGGMREPTQHGHALNVPAARRTQSARSSRRSRKMASVTQPTRNASKPILS